MVSFSLYNVRFNEHFSSFNTVCDGELSLVQKKGSRHHADSLGFDVIDEWGRMIPDPGRWPSSKGGKGFTEVANKVHSLGLKFGIHVMRGISTQAVNANTPILDTTTV